MFSSLLSDEFGQAKNWKVRLGTAKMWVST